MPHGIAGNYEEYSAMAKGKGKKPMSPMKDKKDTKAEYKKGMKGKMPMKYKGMKGGKMPMKGSALESYDRY